MTWVGVELKCPDEEPWIAMTLVGADGETRPLGYLHPDVFARVVDSLRPQIDPERVAEEGHPDGRLLDAQQDLVNWFDVVAELP